MSHHPQHLPRYTDESSRYFIQVGRHSVHKFDIGELGIQEVTLSARFDVRRESIIGFERLTLRDSNAIDSLTLRVLKAFDNLTLDLKADDSLTLEI
jgi:hypothetical protein